MASTDPRNVASGDFASFSVLWTIYFKQQINKASSNQIASMSLIHWYGYGLPVCGGAPVRSCMKQRMGVLYPDRETAMGWLEREPGSATMAGPESGRRLARDRRPGWQMLAAMEWRWPPKLKKNNICI
jgi:hypothetical protein